ncbi:MAG: hypothetical protein KFF49_03485, partial [Bacteroidales bacterium]|nr:hypothetical protein [Bacteroidales bacterium]
RMFESKLYRADQNSFMLYPDKELKSFRSNNNIDREEISGSVLLKQLADKGDRSVIIEDINGNFHFNGTFRNSEDLFSALDHLGPEYGKVSEKEKSVIANIFESVFQHKKFTGRSGSFYKYEGLGSIYWHMVSKMLLAAGEYITRAYDQGSDKETFSRLCSLYYRVRSGIGVDKSPSDYGAFPADPYSHTPSMAGVQQPGMTGQVKEDIISRYIELGLRIEGGRLSFMPVLLRKNEFIKNENGNKSLAFTVCGTPVKYTVGEKLSANIIYKDNREQTCEKAVLNTEQSHDVLQRSGLIQSINVFVTEDQLIEI